MPEEIGYSGSALYDAMVAIGGLSARITGASQETSGQPVLGSTALGGLPSAGDAATAVNDATTSIATEMGRAGEVLAAIARALDNTERGMYGQDDAIEAAMSPDDAPTTVQV